MAEMKKGEKEVTKGERQWLLGTPLLKMQDTDTGFDIKES